MVTVVTALDIVLPASSVRMLLVEVFSQILDGDEAMEGSLRVQLQTNIEAWRLVDCVRGMVTSSYGKIQRCHFQLVQQRAVPQLDIAE